MQFREMAIAGVLATKHATWGLRSIKILLPRLNTVCTADALVDSRHLQIADFWAHYYVPSTPSEGSAADDIAPSLGAKFGHRNREDDYHSLMQRPSGNSASSSSAAPADSYQLSLEANPTCVLLFHPHTQNARPLWYRNLVAAFSQFATVENEDEGPVLYVSTWHMDCESEATSEDARIARLDIMSNMWVADICRLWRGRVTHGDPVFFTWVRPTPITSPVTRTSGHLIVYQHVNRNSVPVLITFRFQALNLDGAAHAVAAIESVATPSHIVDLVKLEQVCRGRKCTFHRGAEGFTLADPLQIGEGLKFVIPPPGGRCRCCFYASC